MIPLMTRQSLKTTPMTHLTEEILALTVATAVMPAMEVTAATEGTAGGTAVAATGETEIGSTLSLPLLVADN